MSSLEEIKIFLGDDSSNHEAWELARLLVYYDQMVGFDRL